MSISDKKHRLVLSPELEQEWKKHRSYFAYKWRTSMYARRLITIIESPVDSNLRKRIQATVQNPSSGVWAAMEKDCLLIEAALATGKIVLSFDEKVRGHFERSSKDVAELRSIMWANPSHPEEGVVTWILAGCERTQDRCLGSGGLQAESADA
jgi:hypothetical protein